jgi:hypothetical protein
MRGLIVLGVMMLALPAAAQNTVITIPTAPCADPPRPAAAAAPVTPSIAAGVAAASNRNFALALANFTPLAEEGDADAERAMGQLLMQNCTGLQDKPVAMEWLNKAAGAGNIAAKNLLGLIYMSGNGVPLDDNKAFALFSQTAATGNAIGELQLGYLYTAGRGVPQDKYQGLQWTVKAGEQGNATALGNIAGAYMRGEILEKDTDRAAYFLVLTNERANPAQRVELMGISQQIRQEVSASDLARETSRAQRWSPGAGSLREVLSDANDFRKHRQASN